MELMSNDINRPNSHVNRVCKCKQIILIKPLQMSKSTSQLLWLQWPHKETFVQNIDPTNFDLPDGKAP